MPLIEGIGDEVTLLLGIFVFVIVLLLAWLSTHTSDIPLLRDVGVIVVELSQRRGRPQNEGISVNAVNSDIVSENERTVNSDDTQVQSTEEAPLAESPVLPNLENETSTENNASENKEALEVKTPASTSNEPLNDETLETLAVGLQQYDSQNGENRDHTDCEPQEMQSLVPKASVVVEETQGGLHATSEDKHPSDEEIRRRRVQYFNTAPETQPSGQMSNENEELANPVTSASKMSDSIPLASNCVESSNRADDTKHVSQPFSPDNSLPLSSQDVHQQASEVADVSRIRVKLKYMNETQRLVYANPFDTIGDFRRNHFQSELEDNKWVRFIYNGQDLRDDGRTLQACNVSDNCTMHCLITTQTRENAPASASHDSEEDTFMGAMMYPLFTFVLLVVWYFRLTYRQYFSAISTICLIGITFLLILSYISTLRSTERRPQEQAAAQDIRNRETQNHQHIE